MATVDVTALLSDPDFSSTFTIYRTTEVVGDNGRKTTQALPPQTVTGVVVPGGLRLVRKEEGDRVSGAITVYSRCRLIPRTRTTPPDEIVYRGRRYIVTAVDDWSAFGSGFYTATCDLREVVPEV
jgi:hypothetical protein